MPAQQFMGQGGAAQVAPQQTQPNTGPGALDLNADPSQFFASIGNIVKPFGGTIGSTTGGKHNAGSLHYGGNAVDIPLGDWRNISPENQQAMIDNLSRQPGIKVRDERQRPAGQKVWGGPHLHVERSGQTAQAAPSPMESRLGRRPVKGREAPSPTELERRIKLAESMGASPDEIKRLVLGSAAPSTKDALGGKPLNATTVEALTKNAERLTNLDDLSTGFVDDYAGDTFGGNARNLAGRLGLPGANQEKAKWWQNYDREKNVIRNELFGAALTPSEEAAFDKADINPNMEPSIIRANLAQQRKVIDRALKRKADVWKAQGYDVDAVETATRSMAPPADDKFKGFKVLD